MEMASSLASTLRGGEIFALEGDLGLGKTTFVKGLARGLGISEIITSPTFNLRHRHDGGRLPLVHFDLYRLKKPWELETLDLETEMNSHAIIAIEWPALVHPLLPSHRTCHILFEEPPSGGRCVTIMEP